jgi:hypothetical protein
MMKLVVILLTASAVAAGATAASAQPYHHHYGYHGPRPHITAPADDWYGNRTCCVLGPAYGRPGEPLGPGRWGDHYTNMRVCGPGACQDNSLY